MYMAKKNSIDASVVEHVLREISAERKAAYEALMASDKEMQAEVAAINEENKEVVIALNDATTDLKAHERFEAHLTKQAFDQRKRELTKALDEAKAAHEAASKAVNERLAPLRQKQQQLIEQSKTLTGEWNSHLRLAKACNVDLKQFWSPENQVVEVVA